MLAVLPKEALHHVASFLELGGVITLRSCCGSFLLSFDFDSRVWKIVRPSNLAPVTRLASACGLQFLNRIYALTGLDVGKPLIGFRSALGAACGANDIPKILWLTRRFEYTFGAIAEATECAAKYGQLDAVKTITHTYDITQEGGVRYPFFLRMLYASIRNGQCNIVFWLITNVPPSEARINVAPRDIVGIIRAACQGPSLHCLMVLAMGLRLSRDDVVAHERYYLGDACFAGRHQSVQWLISHYRINACDLRSSNFVAFRRACDGKQYWLASMLAKSLGINPQELYLHLPLREVNMLWPWLRAARLLTDQSSVLLNIYQRDVPLY